MKAGGGRRPSVVGHRGASARAPENTAASLRAGIAAGADAIEIDVRLSADGRVVVLHDATLDRTTDGQGPLVGWSWEDLTRLDAGAWYSPAFAGESLLDLDAALAVVRGRAHAIVEIKALRERSASPPEEAELRLLDGVLAALYRSGCLDAATVSSMRWPLLSAAAERAPDLALAVTVSLRHRGDPFAAALRAGARALHPDRRLCSPEFAARAHSAGLEVIAYVVNRARELDPLIAAGADGIFSDDPETMCRLIDRREAASSRSEDG
ncbi:MAG: glycerophosphodiester phosphodiesterase [Acidobacteriia bacterium]|nr:glycerophosphodiester phosphodiesterase [Terriglobia bacterium]